MPRLGAQNYDDFPEAVLREIIRKAIDEGCLFELLFTEDGRRLWVNYPEKQMKRMVQEELKRKSSGAG